MPKLLTIRATADVLHVHPNTLRAWEESGRLRPLRVGPRRDRRYDLEIVRALAGLQGLAPHQKRVALVRALRAFSVRHWLTVGASIVAVLIVVGVNARQRAGADAGPVVTFASDSCIGWANSDAAEAISVSKRAEFDEFSDRTAASFEIEPFQSTEAAGTPRALTCSWPPFTRGLDEHQELTGAVVKLSLAGLAAADADGVLLVQTSYGGDNWTTRSTILLRATLSNGTNEGFYSVPLDEVTTVSQVHALQVRVLPSIPEQEQATKVLVDGMSVTATLPATRLHVDRLHPAQCSGWSNASRATATERNALDELSDFTDTTSAVLTRSGDPGVLDVTASGDPGLTCEHFPVIGSTTNDALVNATVNLSLAATGSASADNVVSIEYSVDDGQSWNGLDSIVVSGNIDNWRHGGWWSYQLPPTLERDQLANLRVRARFIGSEVPSTAKVLIDGFTLDLTLRSVKGLERIDLGKFSFLTKRFFLPIEDPIIYVEQEDLQGVEVYDPTGKRIAVPMKLSDQQIGSITQHTVQLKKEFLFTPGSYTIKLKIKSGRRTIVETQIFSWGLVSINTPKSAYKVGDTVPLVFGVVDSKGATVCNADLTVTVIDPSGGVRTLSTKEGTISGSKTCGPDSITAEPDYLTRFTATQSGTYQVRASIVTDNGPESSQSTVVVSPVVSAIIERVAPARINPLQPYLVHLFVTPKDDYEGTFTDTLPGSFVPSDIGQGGRLREESGTKRVVWDVVWKKQKEYELTYAFDPPDISPALFTIGPAQFGQGAETRPWQIASDEVVNKSKPDLAYQPEKTTDEDWNTEVAALAEPSKDFYARNEQAVVTVHEKGFTAEGLNGPVTLSEVKIVAPSGKPAAVDTAQEDLTKGSKQLNVLYLVPTKDLAPGIYHVTAKASDGASTKDVDATFEWGTLTIDPSKTQPKKKTRLTLGLASYGDDGGIRCDDALRLTVKSPGGGTRIFSSDEGSFTVCRDGNNAAEIEYIPSEVGTYTMELRRTRAGEERNITTTLEVGDRPATPKKLRDDMDKSVRAAKDTFRSDESLTIDVKVADAAAFGFLGLPDTVRDVTSITVLDPKGNEVVSGSLRKDIVQSGTTTATFAFDTSRFTRAGRYSAVFDIEQGEYLSEITQDFTWGVLGVNVRRSFPHQNEDTAIGIAVLDDTGTTLCGANVTMTVTDPKKNKKTFSTDKQSITRNPNCVDKAVTNDFDYQAVYRVAGPGTYTMSVTANTKNGVRTISDAFEVKPSVAFDVERTAFSMRIYPLADYEQKLTIVANQDYQGTVVESYPESFTTKEISDGGVEQTLDPDRKQIIWNVDWKQGKRHELTYTIDFPDVSPEFYLVGPLIIGSFSEAPLFRESRQWQIASDAACNATTTGNWSTGGNWTGCTGTGGVPATTDTITINDNVTITADTTATVAGITIADPATGNNGLSISTGVTITVNGNVAYTANTSANTQTITLNGTGGMTVSGTNTFTIPAMTSSGSSNVTCAASATGTLSVGGALSMTSSSTASQTGATTVDMLTCILTAGSISITGGSVTAAEIKASTGTLTSNAAWSFAGTAANAKVTTSGAATVNTAGDFNSGATVSFNSASTFVVNASAAIANYTYTNFNVATGTATFNSGATVTGTLTVGTNNTVSIASSQTLTHTGATLTLNGTISGAGTFEYKSATAFPSTGTISSILRMNAENNAQSLACSGGGGRTFDGAVVFYNGHASTARAITLCNSASQRANFSSTVTLNGAGGGAVTLEANTNDPAVYVTGNFTGGTSGGGTETISLGAGTWTMSGDVTFANSTVSNSTSGTLTMDGTGGKTLTPNGQQFYNVTLSPSGTNTITISGSSINISNTFTVGANTTANISGVGATVAGAGGVCSISLQSTSTLSGTGAIYDYCTSSSFPADGTVTLASLQFNSFYGNVTVPARTFGGSTSITFWNSGPANRTITIGAGELTIPGNISIFTNGAGNLSVDASNVGFNNPIVNLTGNLTFTKNAAGAGTLVTGTNTWTVSGNATFTNGTVTATTNNTWTMNGTSKTLTSAGNALYNFTQSGGTVSMSGATTLNNNLTISSGTLTAPSAANLSVGGDFTNGGTFTHNSGTVIMTGTSKNITGSSATTFNNLTISGTISVATSSPTVATLLTVDNTKSLTIGSGLTLTLSRNNASDSLTLNGTLNGPGRLTYQNSTANSFTTAGTLAATLIVRFDTVNGALTIPARTDYGAIEAYGGSANARTVTLGTAGSQTITTSSYLYVIADASTPNHVTLQGATWDPTLNVGGDFDFTGTVSADEIVIAPDAAATWTVSGHVNFTSGTYTTSAETLVMNGASKTLTTAANGLYNLTFSGTGTTTWADNISAAGDVTLNNTISAGSTTLTMAGSGKALVGGSATINALTLSNNTTVQTSGLTVGGTLTVAAGKTLTITTVTLTNTGTSNVSWGDGTSTIAGTGLLTFTDVSGGPGTTGVLSVPVRFDASTANVPNTTFDARTYGGLVTLYANSGSAKSITAVAGGYTFSGGLTTTAGGVGVVTADLSAATGTTTVTGTLTIGATTSFTAPATLSISVSFSNSGTFTHNSGTVTMNGASGSITGTSVTAFNHLTINDDTTVQTSNATVAGTLTLAASKTLTITTVTLTDTGGEISWGASSVITGTGLLTFTDASGGPGSGGTLSVPVRFDASAANIVSTTFDARTYGGAATLYANSGTAKSITAAAGAYAFSSTLNTTAGGAGTLTANFGAATGSPAVLVTGTLTIGTTTSFTSPASATMNVGASFTNNGAFTHNSGTVALTTATAATITGSTTFNNFSVTGIGAAKAITFVNGTTTTVAGTWTVTGTAGNLITMDRDSTAAWTINPTAASVDYADVSWSTNTGVAFCATHSQSTNGNNTGWSISAGASCGITVSGTVYQTGNESLGYGCNADNLTINVAVNGDATPDAGTCTAADGTFSISNVTDPGAADIPIAIYIDTGETPKATTVTLSSASGANITGLTLIIDRLVVTQESATALTNAHLSTADNGNAGIRYAVSAGALTVDAGIELHVLSGKTFTPGGAVTTTATGTAAGAAGDVHIVGTMTMGTNALNVGGDYTNAGTFNKTNTQTTTLAATGTGFTITPGTGDMNNLTVSGDAGGNGTYTLTGANLTVDGTLTVNTGDTLTIDTSRTLTNTGATNANNDGTISGAGTLTFTNASGGPDSDANSTGTYSSTVRFDASSGDLAATTFDARTYSGKVELYSNSTSNRTATLAAGTYTISGGTSHLYAIAANNGDLILDADTSDPAVSVGGDLDFTGTGSGFEVVAAGNGTWTVSGNVDFTNGIYGPSVASLAPTLQDTVQRWRYFNALSDCAFNTTISCTSSASYGYTEDTDICIVSASDRNEYFEHVWMKYNPTSISDTATVMAVRLGVNVTSGYNYGANLGQSSTDDLTCSNPTTTYNATNASTYGTIDLTTTGDKVFSLGTTGVAEIQSRLTGTTARLTLSISQDVLLGTAMGGISGSTRPTLYVGYVDGGSPTLTMNGASKTLTTAGNTLYNVNLSNTITLSSETHYIGGDLNLTGGDITPGTSTVYMTGVGKTLTAPVAGDTLYAVTIDPPSAGTITMAAGGGDLTVSQNLTVATGDTLSLGSGRTLSHTYSANTLLSGTISGSGTLRYTDTSGGPGTGGTLTSAVRFDASASNIASGTVDVRNSPAYGGPVEFYSNSGTAKTITAPTGTFTYSGTVTITSAGAGSTKLELNTSDPTSTISGALTIGTGSELSANSANALNVNGNYTNNGTFTDNSGTVTLAGSSSQTLSGTMTGSSDFNHLIITNSSGSDPESTPSVIFGAAANTAGTFTATTANTKLRFNASSTYTFVNVVFNGLAIGTRVYLRSSTQGTQWNLTSTGTQTVSNTDVRDSYACGGDSIVATDGSNIDAGNNSCWDVNAITFTVDDNTIGFGTLVTANGRWATGTTGSNAPNGTTIPDAAHTMTIATNALTGWAITYNGASLGGPSTIPNNNTDEDSDGAPGTTATFGISASTSGNSTIASGYLRDASADFTFVSNTTTTLVSESVATAVETITVSALANILGTTPAGTYTTTLTYIASGSF